MQDKNYNPVQKYILNTVFPTVEPNPLNIIKLLIFNVRKIINDIPWAVFQQENGTKSNLRRNLEIIIKRKEKEN